MSDTRTFEPLEFPVWLVWSRRAGAKIPMERRKSTGPSGRPICGWCPNECEGRRTAFCSGKCSDAFGRVWNWNGVRQYVIERDAATCRGCGATEPAAEPTAADVPWWKRPRKRHFWEVDHIVPVRHGGTDHPDNLRLLCRECHRLVGYHQRAIKAVSA